LNLQDAQCNNKDNLLYPVMEISKLI